MNTEEIKVIFILGSGHCGSTLLDILLSSHPNIFGIGELANSKKLKSRCTCDKEVRECSFWGDILLQEKLDSMKIYRDKLSFLMDYDDYILKKTEGKISKNKYINKNVGLFERILSKSNKKVIVDSSKNVHRAEVLSKSDKIDSYIIHLVRDGRGVLWSYKKKYKKTLPFIWKWLAENLKTELIRKRLNSNYIHIQYRDLANRPKKNIRKVLKEIGLKNKKVLSSFGEVEYHQVGGNRMRFSKLDKIEEDTSWKSEISFHSRFLFSLVAGWLNYYYLNKK